MVCWAVFSRHLSTSETYCPWGQNMSDTLKTYPYSFLLSLRYKLTPITNPKKIATLTSQKADYHKTAPVVLASQLILTIKLTRPRNIHLPILKGADLSPAKHDREIWRVSLTNIDNTSFISDCSVFGGVSPLAP